MTSNRNAIWEQLRGYHWYELMKRETRFSQKRINLYPAEDGADSKRATAWKKRKETPSNQSVGRLSKPAPNSASYFRTAPYLLLADRPLEIAEIRELVSVYHDESEATPYRFPVDLPVTNLAAWDDPCQRYDSRCLAKRGDIYGFFAILALVREAEANGDEFAHLRHLRALYACLPALGRYKWLRPDFGLLCKAIRRVHLRVNCSRTILGVDWNIIMEQFDDPDLEPDPQLRPKDPDTGAPVAIADPTFVIKVQDRGRMPRWIGDGAVDSDELHTITVDAGGYDEINEIQGDQLLFFWFMQTMQLWNVGRSDWEACLGVDASTVTTWMDFGVLNIGFIPRMRILALITVRALLHRDASYRADCRRAIHAKRRSLNGDSILGYLRAGKTLALFRQLDKDPVMSGEVGSAGMLPLVSAGVFRLPKEFEDELLRNGKLRHQVG